MANRISVVVDAATSAAERNIKSFRKAVSEADGATGKFKAGAVSLGNTLKANAAGAALAAGTAFAAFAAKAVNAASALEQSVGAVEKSFGDASDAILQMGEDAAESLGLSERAFNELSVRLAPFAKKIADDFGRPVEDVISDLITRGADLAATFGTSVEEAVGKMVSGLSGEMEPLKAFGIILSEAETNAHAVAKGLEDTSKEAQRFGLLMDQSANYAGQFADESDTLAGQQERLNASLENMSAEVGEVLIPAVTDFVGVLNTMVGVLRDIDNVAGGDGFLFDSLFSKDFWKMGPAWDNGPGKILKEITGFESSAAVAELDGVAAASRGADGPTRALAESNRVAALAADELADKQGKLAGSYRSTREEIDDLLAAQDAMYEGQMSLIDADLGRLEAVEDVTRATAEYDSVMSSATSTDEEKNQATLDLIRSTDDAAKAAVDQAEAQAAANGQTLTARDRNRIYRDELQRVADKLNGPAAAAVQGYIDRLGRIPSTVRTNIHANFSTSGSHGYREAVAAATRGQAQFIHDGGFAGGRSFAGLKPDEVPAVLQKGEAVLTKEQQAAVGSGGGKGGTVNITNNFPPGVLPTDVENAQRRYRRAQGPT